MTEVEVTNFQSIEHAQIVVKGYTALVGRSNIGKSAIVRAVKAALTGATGTSFVRHAPNCARRLRDAKKCQCKTTVRIKREGFDLLWEKGDNDNRYTFNGRVYDSVERGTPSFLSGEYGSIKIGDDKELLQVADQFDPIFLLNRTGGVIADVLSDVARLDRINAAMRLVEKDRRDAVATRKVRELDIGDLTQRLLGFDGLDKALGQVRAVEETLPAIEQAEKRLLQIERLLENETAKESEIKHLSGVDGIVVPDSTASRLSVDVLFRLTGWYDRLLALKNWWERAKGVEALTAPNFEPLTVKHTAFKKVDDLSTRFDVLQRDVGLIDSASTKIAEEALGLQAEWDALGLCPTCEQPCRGHAILDAV